MDSPNPRRAETPGLAVTPRFPMVKIVLVPLIAASTYLVTSGAFPAPWETAFGAISAGATALYAYLNETPRFGGSPTRSRSTRAPRPATGSPRSRRATKPRASP